MVDYTKGNYKASIVTYPPELNKGSPLAGKHRVGLFKRGPLFWNAEKHKIFDPDELDAANSLYREYKTEVDKLSKEEE